MSEPKFVHLRVHTAYSLSEGAMLVPKLIHRLHDEGVAAIAVTDTANIFGGKAFSKYASDEGVKPILGSQFYLRNPDSQDLLKCKGKIVEPDKIVLLVMNAEGYSNIMHLMKRAYLDLPNPQEKPQITMADLEKFKVYFSSMLSSGIYIAPSQFEALFISAAHTEADVARTKKAIEKALSQWKVLH